MQCSLLGPSACGALIALLLAAESVRQRPARPLVEKSRLVQIETIKSLLAGSLWQSRRACDSPSLSLKLRTEWLWISTAGDHNVRLGAADRMISVAFTHEQHCMIIMQKAFAADADDLTHLIGHTVHCLNYFRQITLCAADITLEPHDVLSRNYTLRRDGGTHQCFDWPALYDAIQINWEEWRYKLATNSSVSLVTSLPVNVFAA
ncbi:hypothetical protein BU15DRAFT_61394 [Melanogaster broomeanus]|nr:hypothetical protein BU15DRAFT_61394 [Melanogaster broomeanus]